MVRDQMRDLIIARLIRDSSIATTIEALMVFIQESKLEADPVKFWFLENEADVVVPAGSDRVALPSTFIQFYDETPVGKLDTTITTPDQYTPVTPRTLQQLDNGWRGRPVGGAEEFAIFSGRLYIRPFADVDQTLRIRHYQRLARLESNIENGWTLHATDWFIEEVCAAYAADYTEAPERASLHITKAQAARSRLIAQHASRAQAGMSYRMGEL